jgi:hypothetical protein
MRNLLSCNYATLGARQGGLAGETYYQKHYFLNHLAQEPR